jgi:GNAT superfamily N-acetyltransferase
MVEIHPLSPDRADDFMRFFDNEAFTDNPKWASCYCQCYYEDHRRVVWRERTADQNRACAIERIGGNTMQGYLAYLDGHVSGWCNAAPRALLHALDEEPIADSQQTATIVCFLVNPAARGQGIARALLAAACDDLRVRGFRTIEANPRQNTDSASENHYGPLRMYLSAGFVLGKSDPDGSVWVSKTL